MLALIRHGQSLANAGVYKTSRFNLTDDNNVLTLDGVRGALEVGNTLNDLSFYPERMITSGLARAKQTGLIIASALRTGVPIEHDVTFEEIRWYDEDGAYRSYGADEFYTNIDNPPHGRAESQRDVYNRVIPRFSEVARESIGTKYILVCHFFVVRAIRSFLESGGPDMMPAFDPDNTVPHFITDDEIRARV